MSTDKRKGKRRSIDIAGVVHDDADNPVGPAMLRNISGTGAMLELQTEIELPARFTFLLTNSGSVYRKCAKVWQKATVAGVRFI